MGVAHPFSPVNHSDLDSFHAAYSFKLSPQLDEAQRYEALELLYRYKTVFARDMTEIQLCKGEPLKLDLHLTVKYLNASTILANLIRLRWTDRYNKWRKLE